MTKNIDIYIPIDINIVIKSDIKKSFFYYMSYLYSNGWLR